MTSTMRFKSTATLILRLMMETMVAMSIYLMLIMIGRIGKVEVAVEVGRRMGRTSIRNSTSGGPTAHLKGQTATRKNPRRRFRRVMAERTRIAMVSLLMARWK